jgi:hypothetical protein
MERDPRKRRAGEARFALVLSGLFSVAGVVELFADKSHNKGAVPLLLGMAVASSIRSYRRWSAPLPTAPGAHASAEPNAAPAAPSHVTADEDIHSAAQHILKGDDPRVQ